MRPTAINLFPPPAGPALAVAGGTYRILVSGTQTDGAYAVIEMLVPPGGGPGPHAHAAVQEFFQVLEGTVVFRSATQTQAAGPGTVVEIPKGGAVHQFTNESDAPARLLCVVTPAGLDAFFEAIGEPVAAGTLPPPRPAPYPAALQRIQQLGEQYGQEFFPPDYLRK